MAEERPRRRKKEGRGVQNLFLFVIICIQLCRQKRQKSCNDKKYFKDKTVVAQGIQDIMQNFLLTFWMERGYNTVTKR